jgi:Lrp/AsnC family transcriptional regulator for asnA, asnC and gidA
MVIGARQGLADVDRSRGGQAMTPYLDDLDARLISELQVDGRLANTDLARRLQVAEATVRNRIQRLLRDKVIQFGAWADPLKIGYQHYAIVEIQARLPDVDRAARCLARLPEIFFLGICTGSYDIIATAVFQSNEHMHEFMTKRLARVPGIQRTVTASITRIVKRESTHPVAEAGVRRRSRRGPPRRTRVAQEGHPRPLHPRGSRRATPDSPADVRPQR